MSLEIKVTRGPSACSACQRPLLHGEERRACPDCGQESHTACWGPSGRCPACAPAPPAASSHGAPPLAAAPPGTELHGHHLPPGEEPRWLDHPQHVRRVIHVFWGVCGVTLAVDLLTYVGWYHKHPHFRWEELPGFYGVYGFVACVTLVLLAKLLRKLVMRGEDYYG